MALSYSYIIQKFIALNFIYPELWHGENEIREKATRELRSVPRWMRFYSMMTLTIPMLGAMVFVSDSNHAQGSESAWMLKAAFLTLILSSTLGVWFAFFLKEKVDRIVAAYRVE